MTRDPNLQHDSAPLDTHLDDAARRVDEHVAEYAVPLPAPTSAPRRGSTGAIATAVAAALVLIVGVVALIDDPSADEPVRVEQADPDGSESTESGFAGPRDGLDSLRLPIEVSPADGLTDGQVVTVRGSQFPPNRTLGVVMCVGHADRAPGGADNCQLSPYTSVITDSEGEFEVLHRVDRVFGTANEQVDCADAEAEGATWVCLVAVGALDDYDQSGIAEVRFDPDVPPIADPMASIKPDGLLLDGQEISVDVVSAVPGSTWQVNLCGYDAAGGECTDPQSIVADASGAIHTSIVVRRKIGTAFGIDCAAVGATCTIDIYQVDGSQNFSFPLLFVGAEPPPGVTETTVGQTTDTTANGPAPTVPQETTDSTVLGPTTTSTTGG